MAVQFELKMETEGAAFENNREKEIARILRALADHMDCGKWTGSVYLTSILHETVGEAVDILRKG